MTTKAMSLTASGEVLASNLSFYSRGIAFCIGRTRREEPTSDQLEHSALIAFKIARMRCWVNGRMGLIVLLAVPGPLECSIQ